jgi:two-component system chemotaxis sensor kinase CheA
MDYLEAFVEESRALITELNNLLLELEKGNVEVINSIFRIAHTIKGNSAAMGFDGLSELAHAIEDLLKNQSHEEYLLKHLFLSQK